MAAFAALVRSSVASPAPSPALQTIAGTGHAGMSDGRAAEFLMPSGVAVSSSGVIYVADTAAQRIRSIARDGQVSTLAGGGVAAGSSLWVGGAFADGRGNSARFNAPMGLAVAPDGRIFVADSLNHCIRVIGNDGSVGTYAGTPGAAGNTDGSAKTAQFERPMGLAMDKRGTLYVADYGVGVRTIDRSGQVTTTSMPASDTTSVAISPSKRGTIVAAAESGIYYTYPEWTNWGRIPNDESRTKSDTGHTASFYNVGHPVAVAVFNDEDIVYSDMRSGALRYLNLYSGTLRVLTGNAGSDVANDYAGYRDGPLPTALLNGPLGLTLEGSSVVIADTGNRRIRRLNGLNLRGPVIPSKQLFVETVHPRAYRVAYIGNSFVWHNTMWNDSIEGRLEERLNSDRVLGAGGKSAYITPYILQGTDAGAAFNYIQNVLANGTTDAVVLQLNALQFETNRVDWIAFEEGLKKTASTLRASGVPFLVVIHPVAVEMTPNEYVKAFVVGFGSLPPSSAVHGPMLAALRDARVAHLDLWPAFLSEEQTANHRPIFGSFDVHFTAYGRAFMAQNVARALERLRPWAH